MIHIGLSSIVGVFFCLFRPFNPNNTYYIAKIMGKIGLFLTNVKVEIINKERLLVDSPTIFYSNHQENFDIFSIGSIVGPKIVAIGKKSLAMIPIFGQLFVLAGNFIIDRKNKKKAYEQLAVIRSKMLKEKISIWIMPEGTRNHSETLLPFKKGAFKLAKELEATLVPIYVSNYKNINLNKCSPGKVTITVLDAISPEDYKNMDIEELAIFAREKLNHYYERDLLQY